MPTVLITGASRGLGLEFVRQYLKAGWQVIATCRAPDKADGLRAVAGGANGKVEIEVYDVTDAPSAERLAIKVGKRPIDHLIANAGVIGPRDYTPATVDDATWGEVMRVNVMAPLRIATLLTDAVAVSERKLMAFVSSRLGSMGSTRPAASMSIARARRR